MFKALGSSLKGKALETAKNVVGTAIGAAQAAVGEVQVADGVAGVAQILSGSKSLQMTQVGGTDCDCCQCCCPCFTNSECKGEHGGPGFPCCCVHGGLQFDVTDRGTGRKLLEVKEDTTPEGCRAGERCCCHPCQSAVFHFRQPKSEKVLLTVERQGLSAGKCVCCFSCGDCCNDRLAVYEGDVKGVPGELQNAPKMVAMLDQPSGGGCFTPTLDLKPAEGSGSELKVSGPLAFGGCLALCCESDFSVSRHASDPSSVGVIKRELPKNGCELCCACCGGLHKYAVNYQDNVADADRVNMLIGSILVDMVFLQHDQGPCSLEHEHFEINLFSCNCCGCVLPLKCCFKHNLFNCEE